MANQPMRPALAGRLRPPGSRPQAAQLKVASRQEIRSGERGALLSFFPGAGNDSQAVVIAPVASTSAAVAATAIPMDPVPPRAQAAILLVLMTTTTVQAAGHAQVRFFPNDTAAASGTASDAVDQLTGNMSGTSYVWSKQVIVPLFRNKVIYSVDISGTVQYSVNFNHVGWVLG